MVETCKEAFVTKAAELLVHILVSEGKRGEVGLEYHLVLGLRLETHAEEQVVEDLLVGVGRVRSQGIAHEIKIEVRGNRRRVIDWPRRGAA